ncbi:MAG: ferrous iron transport protein A [Deltaproteobacteria bacterium]|nr:ferrous iron transport protein A [Deltaproteobacteria bacterium]
MEEMLTLKEFKPGQKGKVLRLKGKGEVKRRLLDMGIVPGTEIQVEKVAPLGDPVDVLVKGYHLSLRKEEAELVLIERK